MTQYPGAIDGYAQIRLARDGIDEIIAGDHNDLRSAVLALEQTLGVNPHGAYGTVVARLNDYGSRINVNETNFDEHVNGVAFRHNDNHIDTAPKVAVFNGLVGPTLDIQLEELLLLFDYPGSFSTFADGAGLGVQNFRITPDDIVEQLGSPGGYEKIGTGLVPGIPLSLPAGAVRDHVSTLLASQNAASASDIFSPTGGIGGGIFPSLDERIEAGDHHARTVISCTDGVTTEGGMYNGMDALERALLDVAATGGTILVRGGEYHITVPHILPRPVKIIGVEQRPTVVNEVGTFMLTFEHDAYGSTIQNIEIINFGAGAYQAFVSDCDDFLVKQCEIEGTIYLQSGRRPRVEQTRVTPVGVDCISTGPGCILAEISQCELAPVGEVTLLNHNGFGCVVSNTFFIDGYGAQAIIGAGGTSGLKIHDCAVRCEPYKANTPVIDFGGDRTEVNGLYMYTYGPGIISTSFIRSEADILKIQNLRINMNENVLGHSDSSNNPISLSCADLVIDGFFMYGGWIPMTIRDGFTLSTDHPVIQLSGRPAADPTYTMSEGRVKLINAMISSPTDGGAPAGNMTIVILGDSGQGGLEPATPFGIMELENVTIQGFSSTNWNLGDSKYMVGNVQEGSLIQGCTFTGGNWDAVIALSDSHRTRVQNNYFKFTGVGAIGSAVLVAPSLAPVVEHVQISDNNILINDLNSLAPTVATIFAFGANGATINSNVIVDVSGGGTGPMVSLTACDYSTVLSNVLDARIGFPSFVDAAPGPIGNLYTHGVLGPLDLNKWT